MARADIDDILKRIDKLALEIKEFVPIDNRNLEFRADLAGLLVVAIAASYESCVKETIISYASRHNVRFANFIQKNFEKLNSKVAINHLYNYAETFDKNVHAKFKSSLKIRTSKIKGRVGRDFIESYGQILRWRHGFAHTGVRNTTIEEALVTHKFGKRVIYCFEEAFYE